MKVLQVYKLNYRTMSTFLGPIKPYPSIVVDKFTGIFQHGFITHGHTDHLVGLQKFSAKPPSNPDTKFYATSITKNILIAQMRYELINIKVLKINKTVKLNLEDGFVYVTPLPANHIPGSAMFLFEGDKGNVLHTGDFRLRLEQLKDTPLFRDTDRGRQVIPLDYLYIDNTFWRPDAYKLPPANKSKELIIHRALEWLTASEDHVVYLLLAYFGYADILYELSERAQLKININESRSADKFKSVPYLSGVITDDTKARIFVKDKPYGNVKKKKLKVMYSKNTRMIMVSTMHFVTNNMSRCACEVRDKLNLFWVNHSLHCSQAELNDFVTKLNPKEVIPPLEVEKSKSKH